MPKLYRSMLALSLCGALSAPAIAGTPFNQMIVFGGSYEDAGQFPDIDFFAVGGIIPPPGAGLDGSTGFRVTNLVPETGKRGTVWPEKLSNDLGIGGLQPSTPILFPGERTDIPDTDNIDFAFATARSNDMYQAVVAESVVTHPADGALEADLSETSPGFEQRLASGALSITRRTLFVLNPAGNDVRDATVENPAAAGEGAALNTLRMIERLMTSGARTFVTPTQPGARRWPNPQERGPQCGGRGLQ
jgi:outer membrane lipase/esterase